MNGHDFLDLWCACVKIWKNVYGNCLVRGAVEVKLRKRLEPQARPLTGDGSHRFPDADFDQLESKNWHPHALLR